MVRAMARNGIVYEDDDNCKPVTEAIKEAAAIYQEELVGLSKQQVRALYNEELKKKYVEDDQRRFFNQPKAKADFNYWSKMPEWTLDEAIVLSFGKNPEYVTWSQLNAILSYTSPFVEECIKLRKLVERAKKAHHFTDAALPTQYDPIRPYKFVQWMQANGISFPEKLAANVLQSNIVSARPKTPVERTLEQLNEPIKQPPFVRTASDAFKKPTGKVEPATIKPRAFHTKEKATLLKIIIAMAMKGYRYDPTAKRNESISEIKGDLNALGLNLDEDTIRNKLKESAKLVDQNILNQDS